jgi:hypothetical protein
MFARRLRVLTIFCVYVFRFGVFVRVNRMCAPVMVELEGETDPLQIAMKELK